MASSYRVELENYLSKIEINCHSVLGVGDAQLKTDKRVKSWDVENYVIADLPEPHANSPKPDIEFDLQKQDWKYEFGDWQFDVVFCLEVFDYILLPDCAMSNLYDMTKEGGKVYVTFPFVYPTHNPIKSDMLRYTEFAVRELARLTGFRIVEIIPRRPETNAIDNLWRAERMRAAKGYDRDVTGWIAELVK